MENSSEKKRLTSLGSIFKNGRRVLREAWQSHRWYVIALLALATLGASIPYMQLGIFGLIVDEVIGLISSSDIAFSDRLIQLLVAESLLLLLPLIVADLNRGMGTIFRFVFLEKLSLKIVRKMADIDIATHEKPEFNDKLNTANERGVFALYGVWQNQIAIFRNIIGVLVAGIILFSVNWIFLVLAFVGAFPALFIEIRYGQYVYWIWDLDAERRRLFFDRRAHFNDLTYLIELKLFQAVNFFYLEMQSLLGGFTKKQVEAEKKKLSSEVLGSVIFSGTLIASIVLLIQFTLEGAILVGTMTFVFGSIRGFQGTLISFFKTLGSQEETNRFAEDIFEILDTKREMTVPTNPIRIRSTEPPKIEFRDVSFKYPGSKDWVLENFNLTIEPGENLSIVGINGAGKTTFVKLLSRFYDPNRGQILINNIDLKELDIEEWRSMTAVLFQEFADYSFPIDQAIAIGRATESIDQDKVRKSARSSEAEGFINKLDGGFNQMLGKKFKGGVQLSVGQNQRMAIARVFYRNAQVTILDEPTASIDAEAEEQIFEQINEEMREKTVITISHRFSTVKRSDKIAVIEGGKITEYGDHTHLVLLGGTYARLYELQAQAYQD